MKHHLVKLFTDAARGITTDPFPVRVKPGDTISWTSEEGKIAVAFTDAPLDALQFSAERHAATKHARVRADAPRGKSFRCTASIDGKPADVWGIEIEPGP